MLVRSADAEKLGAGTAVEADITGVGRARGRIVARSALGLHVEFTEFEPTARGALQARLDAIRAESGFGPANPPILQISLYSSESEQEVQEDIERHFAEYVDSVMRHYELGGAHLETTKGYESYRSSGGKSAFGSGERSDAYAKLASLFLDNAILGTPETCVEKIVALQELMEPSEMVFIPTIGTMSAAKSERSMRLLAEKVLPRVADARAKVTAS